MSLFSVRGRGFIEQAEGRLLLDLLAVILNACWILPRDYPGNNSSTGGGARC